MNHLHYGYVDVSEGHWALKYHLRYFELSRILDYMNKVPFSSNKVIMAKLSIYFQGPPAVGFGSKWWWFIIRGLHILLLRVGTHKQRSFCINYNITGYNAAPEYFTANTAKRTNSKASSIWTDSQWWENYTSASFTTTKITIEWPRETNRSCSGKTQSSSKGRARTKRSRGTCEERTTSQEGD